VYVSCKHTYVYVVVVALLQSGFDLLPGSPGFYPGWKTCDPLWKVPPKVQPGSSFDPGRRCVHPCTAIKLRIRIGPERTGTAFRFFLKRADGVLAHFRIYYQWHIRILLNYCAHITFV